MRGKLLFITGGLVGYVLGARAGRQRYDQIASAASDLWNRPPVQRRVNEVKDFALERVGDVPGALLDAGKKVVTAVQDKTSSSPKKPATGTDAGSATAAGKAAAAATTSAKSAAASAGAAARSAQAASDSDAQ